MTDAGRGAAAPTTLDLPRVHEAARHGPGDLRAFAAALAHAQGG